jgi:hypothetical protein
MNKILSNKGSIKQLVLLPIVIISAIYSQTSFAAVSNCGIVSTKMLFLKNNEFEVRLKSQIKNNSEKTEYTSWNLSKRLILAPGKHLFKARTIGAGHRGNSEMTVRGGIFDSQMHRSIEFELDIEKGYVYRLVAQEIKSSAKDRGDNFRIKIKSMKPQECIHKQVDIIPAIPPVKLSEGVTIIDPEIALPSALQYRLDLLTKDLHTHYKEQDESLRTVSLIQEQKMTRQFGIVTETKSKIKQGISVVAVSPFSLAARIGILAGDQIIGLNINNVSRSQEQFESDGQVTAIAALKYNLDNLAPKDNIIFRIKRENEFQELSVSYEEISLPAYQLDVYVK